MVEAEPAHEPARAMGSAAPAQIVTLALAAGVLALQPAPGHWRAAERTLDATAMRPGGLLDLVRGMARALPVGELAQRIDLLAVLLLLGLAVLTTRAAHALLPGVGRTAAAIAAGTLTVAGAAAWSREVGSPDALGPLAAAMVGMLGMLGMSGMLALVRRNRRNRPKWTTPAALLLSLPPALGLVALAVLGEPAQVVHLPSLHTSARWAAMPMPPALAFAALAWLLYAGWMAGWRRAAPLAAVAMLAMVLADRDGPLLTMPLRVAGASIAAAGWVGLLARVAPSGPLAAMSSLTAAAAVLVVGWPGPWGLPSPVALERPSRSVLDVTERGMVAPGDVVLIHDRWLLDATADRRAVEGWRPDVLLRDATVPSPGELRARRLAWAQQGRRVLSDSFDLAGRVPAQWVVDSGPLFWIVGPGVVDEREFTDLESLLPARPTASREERRRWQVMQVERARFRRAVGAPDSALSALALDDARRRALRMRLQLARAATAESDAAAELGAPPPSETSGEAAWSTAEAGDLMFSVGAYTRAAQLLAEADAQQMSEALPALVRWHVRAGQTDQALAAVDTLIAAGDRRAQVVGIAAWLVARGRGDLSRQVLARLPSSDEAGLDEAAVRLASLAAIVPASGPTPRPRPSESATAER